jgi:hypothetical protein
VGLGVGTGGIITFALQSAWEQSFVTSGATPENSQWRQARWAGGPQSSEHLRQQPDDLSAIPACDEPPQATAAIYDEVDKRANLPTASPATSNDSSDSFSKEQSKALKPHALLLFLRDMDLTNATIHKELLPDVPLCSIQWTSIVAQANDLARNTRRRIFLSDDMIALV